MEGVYDAMSRFVNLEKENQTLDYNSRDTEQFRSTLKNK